MYILIGPDSTGKTTLANKLHALTGMAVYHHDMNTPYETYVEELVKSDSMMSIMDRFIICEVPYHAVLNRRFGYTRKQFHNVLLLALAHNPLIILFTHCATGDPGYDDSVLPRASWEACLAGYRRFLKDNHIPYLVYDYSDFLEVHRPAETAFGRSEEDSRTQAAWWEEFWKAGVGFVGSHNPDVLIVAERLGPNNMNNIPFETGPTGRMMTELLDHTGFPLGKIAITNLIKAPRRDTREPNARDMQLLDYELDQLRPKGVLVMGSVARKAIPLLKSHGAPYSEVPHLGYYHRLGVRDMTKIYNEMGLIMWELAGRKEPGVAVQTL